MRINVIQIEDDRTWDDNTDHRVTHEAWIAHTLYRMEAIAMQTSQMEKNAINFISIMQLGQHMVTLRIT